MIGTVGGGRTICCRHAAGHYPKNQRGSKFGLTTGAGDLEQVAIIKFFDFVHRPDESRMVPWFGPEGERWRWAEEGGMAYTGETALWKQITVYESVHNHLLGHMFPGYFEEGFFDRQVPDSDDPAIDRAAPVLGDDREGRGAPARGDRAAVDS